MMEKHVSRVVFILLVITLGLLWQVKRGEADPPASLERGDTARPLPSAAVEITFLDVGQGDAAFIEWPNQTQMLIDCGPDTSVLEGLGRVLPFYDRTIDYLIVTHPDLDHYGGCIDVLARYQIANIVYTGLPKSDPSWQYFWEEAQAEGAKYHQIERAQTWEIGSTTLRFLSPDHQVKADEKDNNTSIVIKLSSGDSDVLLAADAEKELEEYLVNTYSTQLASEALKVSHHGSGGSSLISFIQAVKPAHAVISVGADNEYGHPSLRVLRRLERSGARIWRTDLSGDIKVRLYNDHIEVDD